MQDRAKNTDKREISIRKKEKINDERNIREKEKINDFIQNPVKIGLWETVFKWNQNNDIESRIDKDYTNDLLSLSRSLSPLDILEIFDFLIKRDRKRRSRKPNYLRDISEDTLKDLITKLEDEKMMDVSIRIRDNEEGIEINGEYAYILKQRRRSNNFTILSINKEISTIIEKIFEFFNCIFSSKARFVRSPQTKLINPLFYFTDIISNNIFTDLENAYYFDKAYYLYYDKEYEDSISYIGKMTESLLTNIYESLFRENIPHGYTLGKIKDSIEFKVDDLSKSDKKIDKPANFEKIIELHKKQESKDITSIVMTIATLLKEEQKYRDSLDKNPSSTGHGEGKIFPKDIRGNLGKLVNYRNSVSHNSGEYFNKEDCQKMLFYFLSVYNWWYNLYDKIDWTKEKIKDIIDDIIKENKR